MNDFPGYVDLSALPAGFHTYVQNGGGDIRVTLHDGITELPREVVSYDSATDTGELWFKGSFSQDADTDFYIYYGNADASDYAPTDPYGSQNVWGANAKYVGHFQNSYADSSVSTTSITDVGSPTYVTGKVGGKGISFNGTNQEILVNSSAMSHTGSISMWFNNQAYGTPDPGGTTSLFNSGIDARTRFNQNSGTGSRTMAFIKGNPAVIKVTVSFVDNTWHKVRMSWIPTTGSNGTVKEYIDGVLIKTDTYTDVTTAPATLRIGGFNGVSPAGGWFNGYVDEARVLNTIVTDEVNYELTEYNNQSDPGTFWGIGKQESLGISPSPSTEPDLTVFVFNDLLIADIVTINLFKSVPFTGIRPSGSMRGRSIIGNVRTESIIGKMNSN